MIFDLKLLMAVEIAFYTYYLFIYLQIIPMIELYNDSIVNMLIFLQYCKLLYTFYVYFHNISR